MLKCWYLLYDTLLDAVCWAILHSVHHASMTLFYDYDRPTALGAATLSDSLSWTEIAGFAQGKGVGEIVFPWCPG